mgnify:CR=1 FL=1
MQFYAESVAAIFLSLGTTFHHRAAPKDLVLPGENLGKDKGFNLGNPSTQAI